MAAGNKAGSKAESGEGTSAPAGKAARPKGGLDALSEAIESGAGLPAVVRAAAGALGANVALIDRSSAVLAVAAGSGAEEEKLLGLGSGVESVELRVADAVVGELRYRVRSGDDASVGALRMVATLLGLEVERGARPRVGERRRRPDVRPRRTQPGARRRGRHQCARGGARERLGRRRRRGDRPRPPALRSGRRLARPRAHAGPARGPLRLERGPGGRRRRDRARKPRAASPPRCATAGHRAF